MTRLSVGDPMVELEEKPKKFRKQIFCLPVVKDERHQPGIERNHGNSRLS